MEGKQSLRIMFASAVGTVTGSHFLLETPAGDHIAIDCGLVQGEKVALDVNYGPFPFDPRSIGALLVTHAHLDHVGRIPKLVKEGFSGAIYSTPETKELARLVLEDAVGIIKEEAERDGREPIYGLEDVQRAFPLWRTVSYHQSFQPAPGVDAVLKDAGHILGSSMIEVSAGGKKVLFTGDLGNSPAPLLRDTEQAGDIDCLVMESTYGDENHEAKDQREARLERVIKEALGRGGTLVIPAFSIDRAQVLIFELNNLMESGRIPRVPVFVDSPMAIRATEIYKASESLFNDRARAQIARGDDIFMFPGLVMADTQDESRHIEAMRGAKIILAGSGMSVGGRVIRHEEYYLPDPTSTLLLVGYQGVGSLGRELADGATKVRIHGRDIRVQAAVEAIYGYSAHKDSDHLVQFVSTATARLKEVFLVHGEPGASLHLAQRLNDELDAHAAMPKIGQWYEVA